MYVHTNKTNGKRYVGITSKPKVEHRWNNGRGYSENTHFSSAIQKYGWDGFIHTVLLSELTENQAKSLECHLIKSWKTQNPKYGYNMTFGGDGTPGFHPSEETRKKLSEARKKENLSAETLKRRSDGLRGRKFSDEHKRKIGAGNSKPIAMLNNDNIVIKHFNSAHDAEVETGISHSHISQCCNGKRKNSGGYRWRFAQSL